MNKLTIIGNLTRDPELRTTSTGVNVCSFTVAVNRRRSAQGGNQPEADFFRVSAWRQLGENCAK
ncbi:MAG TPA: single-stranded DNA-binding protein, partial [Candidatus Limiplasma stercoravium]|nr:single-stranded DNA-binding protein [Candidatus Limiplasma stercoravium]